ncbi:LysR family transcriptional regulator [Xylophilus sp.]|uniref:LysR family transcriptional regulator n=1 Tax=Xylophilus sp. TaxID=2653893 RepID=UPI0013B8A3C8|nr:LysR family transcriptional regulator [Xylophilus sp.]KAF1049361.1 MAG: HTH-type transcriptional regulator TfdS [Xylophilus sp.]
MDLRQLSYFIAVAEEGHLGRAAERLCLSQPPLTRQIQALERELSVKIFERTAKGMVLTQAGDALLKDAYTIRDLVRQAAERARRAGLGQLGRLDIGVFGSSIFGVVPKVLSLFTASHPDVELTLHNTTATDQIVALHQGRVLLAFARWMPDDADVAMELVAHEQLLVALSERHPLAQRQAIDVYELRNEQFIVGVAPVLAASVLELGRKHGFEPRLAPPTSDIVMAALMAAAGTGISLVPASMKNVHFPGMVYRPLKEEAVVDIRCYYMRKETSPLLAALLETIRTFRASGGVDFRG